MLEYSWGCLSKVIRPSLCLAGVQRHSKVIQDSYLTRTYEEGGERERGGGGSV